MPLIDLSTLNPPQRAAVTHRDGPLLVLAGAGSGKTRVITFRIAHLVDNGVPPGNILAVSFTNKAANEMRERVAGVLGPERARRVHLSTFHALGAQILREQIERTGFKRPFSIVDEGERRRIIRQVLKELRLDGTKAGAANLLNLISRAKNHMCSPAGLREARFNPEIPRAERVYRLYNDALRNLNAMDFDDLLLHPTQLLFEHADLREAYRRRYRFIMVDEYQDTNPLQLKMLEQLVCPTDRNLVVVGDDDQSIYGFRGAASDTILRFDKTFPGARVVTLEQNYRSVGTVLAAANAVIANNSARREKTLWSELGDGRTIRAVSVETPADEADFVAGWIGKQADLERRPWSDFAILYRANPQAGDHEDALRRRHIPYRVVGGQSVFDNKEVRDLVAYLRLVMNPLDELALRRIINVPTRGIGTTTLTRLVETAAEQQRPLWTVLLDQARSGDLRERVAAAVLDLADAITEARNALEGQDISRLEPALLHLIDRIGLERAVHAAEANPNVARARWRVVERLLNGLSRLRGADAMAALERWVTDISLEAPSTDEDEDDHRNKVTLLTIHASKGLEFPVVFMVGMNDDFLPHWRAKEEPGGIEEERRLCYVGMTRAQQRLVLTHSRSVLTSKERRRLKPSPFLGEIPETLIETRILRRNPDAEEREQKARESRFDDFMQKLAQLRDEE